ncbi:MAG: ABC transporter permease [Jatrophihabitantaceae bacterium]
MTAAAFLVRSVLGDELRLPRAAAMTSRNATLLRSAKAYAVLLVSGFAEPVFYLVSIGWGVGSLIGSITLADGRQVSYLSYVAPALLASAAMSGALAETTTNFFGKLRYQRQYEAVLNTPLTPGDVAFGELGWAMVRGVLYTAAFLTVMVGIGATTPVRALAALPVAVLVGLAFGGLGLAISSFMRSWQDIEYILGVEFALFLFSGTFVPVQAYPAGLQAVVRLTPLYQGVQMLRGITLGGPSWSLLGNAGYLVALAVVTMAIAIRRIRRLFRT